MFSWLKKRKKSDTVTKEKVKNIPNFDDKIAKEILAQIKQEYGLDYSKQEYITMRKLERFALKHEIYDFSRLRSLINSTPLAKEQLINMLTVGETYFYREVGHFKILAELMCEKNITRVLCAPSSSGEEAYSILIYIYENYNKNNNLHVTGIDVNSLSIESAKKGCFSKRSVSFLSDAILNKYFTNSDLKYCINTSFKRNVTFQQQNIFDASLQELEKFDVIFCRNMLIYFNDVQKKEAIANLRALLNPEGILFIGHADISFEPDGFTKVSSLSGSYFKKV